ncbi:PREDICTED: O(6)-methylguanine-induced apoptosis 2 [Crocodylus porosus]|uniref:O(6)-methylguanine-induced apoptosis 2 n=1 Tax=Crocodylus porosus TaxID=8502 RepID=UPI0009391280|nr:PREDICTED: O(6)-methylguanine-induced apoptosis 2 [Crocodylus porosus]
MEACSESLPRTSSIERINPVHTGKVFKGYTGPTVPYKHNARVIPNSEKKGFNSQAKRFQFNKEESPGPGFYNVIHQSPEFNSTSLSKKGTGYFPSGDTRIARNLIPSYPAANAYSIASCFQSKRDFGTGNSSMFQQPIARKLKKMPTPAPNQYNERCANGAVFVSFQIVGMRRPELAFYKPPLLQFPRSRWHSYIQVYNGLSSTALHILYCASTDFCKQSNNVCAWAAFVSRTVRGLSSAKAEKWPSPSRPSGGPGAAGGSRGPRMVRGPACSSPRRGCIFTASSGCAKGAESCRGTSRDREGARGKRWVEPEAGSSSAGGISASITSLGITSLSTLFSPGRYKYGLNFSAAAIPPPKDPPLPGPGQYDVVDYKDPAKQYISSAVFVSNTGRWTGDQSREGLPGPGTYWPHVPEKQSFLCNADKKWVPVL